ncbi:DUF4185 domain-containing protein [Gordonia sp. HY002]|uniref:DUF4185 domain-containing protein n=1 Tax=Gordonia zhenghanii TaxID=2911516 RepID=UPI001EEFB98E|nr:DUF4185 domain-containing protein [Gordonia zhenghanii]MCF8568805.1 DUF4185 domain-containing protein [Gordonia zhenghanii]MCF8602325.1 DUF4185 domain-containing protein [Gordonia zhenghanii]
MRRLTRAFTTLTISAAMAAAALTAGVTAPPANASGACSNSGTGIPLPFDFGSLGFPRGGAAQGPQKPLPHFDNGRTKTISWVTGPLSHNKTFSRFGISGTDVGVAWDNGRGQTLMAFGDTFGNCLRQDRGWRNNTLLRSTDSSLANGLTLQRSGYAGPMFGAFGFSGIEKTKIPTAGISIGGKQYVNYMSVRAWGPPSRWFTNYSATAVSSNNGRSWYTPQSTIRANVGLDVPLPAGWPSVNHVNPLFQQSAYLKGEGADAGWVYQYGTPNGRFGAAHIARFRPGDILNPGKYQYWTGSRWAGGAARPAAIVRGPVTELSVSWSPYLKKYVMLDSPNGVKLRTANHPQGPWSPGRRIAPSSLELYAPMMLPSSPALRGTGPELYFNASRWDDYNVALIRTKVR